eukprot:3080247-Alexandrium_andersonii.AAC.1
MSASLVGSEMCIRDSRQKDCKVRRPRRLHEQCMSNKEQPAHLARPMRTCLLYTSDAADDM